MEVPESTTVSNVPFKSRSATSPSAIAANSIPIIAIAPITNAMFSLTSPVSKMAVVAIVVFFPVMINTARGLTEVDPAEIELMRSYAASPTQILLKVRVPNAVPYLFTALKIAAPVAVITAFVAEYFGGPQNGLGYGITSSATVSRNDAMWAYVVGACALGLTFFLVSVGLEKTTTHQQQHTGGAAPGGATT